MEPGLGALARLEAAGSAGSDAGAAPDAGALDAGALDAGAAVLAAAAWESSGET